MLKPYDRAHIQFERVKEIGFNGQNSKTFVVRDHQLDAEIVMKQIEKKRLASQSDYFNESKALYASAHPNVVQIHYACEDNDHIYLAMPYYKKGSLRTLIEGRHMTVREIITAASQVLSGLHNIHSKGLIHFDVKPDNILLSDRGDALLSDFGLAKQINFSGIAVQDQFYMKTMPPEAIDRDQFDLAFDIFQVGLTLYRMCNGEEVFREQLAKYGPATSFDRDQFRYDLRNAKFPDRKIFPAHIPARMRSVVTQCLNPDKSKRFGSAVDVANALAPIDGPTLDWRLESKQGMREWKKNESGTGYLLRVSADGNCECLKTVGEGKPRRVAEACIASVTEAQLRKILGDT